MNQLIEKRFFPSLDGTKLCGVFTVPRKGVKGFAILLHGLGGTKDEYGGFYKELSEKLCGEGYATLRFDFRGHGESEGYQREFTVTGQILDIKASVREVSKIWNGNISLVATSFGAGAGVIYTAIHGRNIIDRLVLISPVLDYQQTFLTPKTPWMKTQFTNEKLRDAEETGYISFEGMFDIGIKLIEEMRIIKPYEYIRTLDKPILTIHGERDTIVPVETSMEHGVPNRHSRLVILPNTDHGYIAYGDDGESEASLRNRAQIIQWTADWLRGRLV